MATEWHLLADATPTPREMKTMAALLEGRHGAHAAAVAEFLATLHDQSGDPARSWAWAGVAALVRKRERTRLVNG